MSVKLLTEHHSEFLCLKGGCTGSMESTLVKMHIVGNHMTWQFVFQEKREKKEKKKYITVDPNLLLSFIYFDQNHTGYLLDKDAEEILHAIGLSQSRAQVCYLTVQPLNITNITQQMPCLL